MTTDTLNKYGIVVGIDFGTTYSGYKIELLKDPDFVFGLKFVETINLNHEMIYKDYRTVLSIGTDFNELYTRYKEAQIRGYTDTYEHTFDPESEYCVSNFKLWLDRTAKKEDLPPLPDNKSPVQVIADYLSQMCKEIYEKLYDYYSGYKDPPKHRLCMAVPTMWSEESKNIMREAAILSDLIKIDDPPDKLLIVDEAVAAALYAENASPELGLSSGSRYMICDAGGGTVDLAVFEKDDSLGAGGLKEITMGTGDSCGSAFLNNRFKDLLNERISKYPDYKKDYMKDIKRYFDYLKKVFGGDDDEVSEWLKGLNQLYIDGHDDISEKDGFTLDELRTKVFDPVVEKVLCIIESQFEQLNDRYIDVMFITGGFGQSPYLQRRIKDVFKSRTIRIKVIKNGNRAVMKGAVLFGANPRIITQRILRRTYGIKLCSPDKTKDDTKAQFDKDKFHVYIHKGQPVNEDKWISRKMNWTNDTLSIISLYAYDGEEPIPEHPTPHEIDLVAMLGTKFKIDTREKVDRVIDMKMRFGLDRIDVKVIISGVEFKYVTIYDVVGEKSVKNYKGFHLRLFFREKFRSFKEYIVRTTP